MNAKNAKKNTQWSRLDNAAKIFPPTSNKRDTKVFRFACELYETIDADILQTALNRTLEVFPGYLTVLKRGLFWYYLEATSLRPVVHEENQPPCSPLYDKNVRSLLFDVSFYKKRINLEVYHSLTDGTGALQFLRVLVYHYLCLAHKADLGDSLPVIDYDASNAEKMSDGFQKYYDPKQKKGNKSRLAYQLKGAHIPENRLRIIEGIVPVKDVLALARERNTTVTVLLASILLCAIHDGMTIHDRKKPVSISVPVNLRQYFPSESARNFFGIISITYPFATRSSDLEDVIAYVDKFFRENLIPEKLAQHMNALAALEHNLVARIIPLSVKDWGMWVAYRYSTKTETAALSNIGKVSMPEALQAYIRLFDVFISTEKLQICMCSYGKNMVISFSSPFASADIQKYFFRTLTGMGIGVELVTNPIEESHVHDAPVKSSHPDKPVKEKKEKKNRKTLPPEEDEPGGSK